MQPKQCEESEKRARRNQIRERRVKEARNVRSLATLCFSNAFVKRVCNLQWCISHRVFFFTSWIRTFCGEGAAFQLENTPVVDALRDRCSISYDLASPFCGRTQCCRDIQAKKNKSYWDCQEPHAEKLQFQPLNVKVARKSCRVASFSS